MTMHAFDTLSYARHMEAVGFTRAQAEAMAEEQSKLIDERLATKTDIELIRKDIEQLRKDTQTDIELIRRDIEQLRKDTKADIEQLRKDTKLDIEQLRKDMKMDIELVRKDMREIELRMTVKLGTITTAVAALFATVVHFWH